MNKFTSRNNKISFDIICFRINYQCCPCYQCHPINVIITIKNFCLSSVRFVMYTFRWSQLLCSNPLLPFYTSMGLRFSDVGQPRGWPMLVDWTCLKYYLYSLKYVLVFHDFRVVERILVKSYFFCFLTAYPLVRIRSSSFVQGYMLQNFPFCDLRNTINPFSEHKSRS
jgi:hypothetical protein